MKINRKMYVYIGVIGSGKDYQCKLKSKEINGKIFDFSDGVRDITFGFLGYKPDSEELYTKFKSKITELSLPNYKKVITGRKFLQNVGQTMRNYDSDFWIKYCLKKINQYVIEGGENIIVNSCRFLNEAEVLFNYSKEISSNIHFIFCDYHSNRYEINKDISEKFAQEFLLLGCKDGEDITKQIIEKLRK